MILSCEKLANPAMAQALKSLGSDNSFKAKDRLKIARFITRWEAEGKNFDKTRNDLVKKYLAIGEKRMHLPEGSLKKLQEPEVQDYLREYQPLLQETFEIVVPKKLTLPEDSKLTACELSLLEFIINLDEEEPEPPKKKKKAPVPHED